MKTGIELIAQEREEQLRTERRRLVRLWLSPQKDCLKKINNPMTPIVFQSGIPAVCQNWPGDKPNSYDFGHHNKKGYSNAVTKYELAVAASIASAIPLVESDREAVEKWIWENLSDRLLFHSVVDWQPVDGTVYMISVGIEIEWEHRFNQSAWNRVFNQTGIEFVKKQHPNWEFRQVMRLTPTDKKEPPNPLIVVGNLGPIISFGCSFPKCNCQNGMEKCKEQREAVEPDSGKEEVPEYVKIQRTTKVKAQFYATYFEEMKAIAKDFGYNLCLHGSLTRDMDIVAIPWIDAPATQIKLIIAISDYIGGGIMEGHEKYAKHLPGGRTSYVINLNRGGYKNQNIFEEDCQYYIDISVTPTVNPPPVEREGGSQEEQDKMWLEIFGANYIKMYEDGGFDRKICRIMSSKFTLTRKDGEVTE